MDLKVHHLRFTLQATTLVRLGPQAGAQIRGALWAALKTFACTDPANQSDPEHVKHCPMCRVFHLETQQGERGVNPARPFAIRPPLASAPEDNRVYQTGDHFEFGINLFGGVEELFPYIARGVHQMGHIGLGYGRGRFVIKYVKAVNPLTHQQQDLYADGKIIAAPAVPVLPQQVAVISNNISAQVVTLRFITPTQITIKDKITRQPDFQPLVARLIERCQSIELHYTESPTPQPVWRDLYLSLSEQAADVNVLRDETWWVHIQSGSRRSDSRNSISGFVGEVTFEGELKPFMEWIIWGQSLHVGKNTAKGDGWYEIIV